MKILTKNKQSGMIPRPSDWLDRQYNCNEPCDMLVGPCACGSTHVETEEQVKDILLKHNTVIK